MKKSQTLSALKKKLWDLVSKYVRLSAADEGGTVECYTCGRLMHWEKDGAQAGHAIPGRHNAVLYDLDVIRVQCYSCNCPKRGNYPIFTTKLIKEKGLPWWECKLADSRKTLKLTKADILEKIEHYKAKLEGLRGRRD